jgi:hypothetical protein
MTLKSFHFNHSFFPSLTFPSLQSLAVIAVKLEESGKLLKNPASIINQFAIAQIRHIDLNLLTKTTVAMIIRALSLTA